LTLGSSRTSALTYSSGDMSISRNIECLYNIISYYTFETFENNLFVYTPGSTVATKLIADESMVK
jgi:hypothetical protein